MSENQGESAKFDEKCIEEIMKSKYRDPSKWRITKDGLKAVSEVTRIFAAEGAARAALQATSEGEKQVSVEQFEKILPQLLLDF